MQTTSLRCSASEFDGVTFLCEEKEALWDRDVMAHALTSRARRSNTASWDIQTARYRGRQAQTPVL